MGIGHQSSLQKEDEELFTIKKSHLETGLRSFPVGYCTTSSVDPEQGLFYCGTKLSSLTHHRPEELIFLLLEGHLPSTQELEDFIRTLRELSDLPPGLAEQIEALPRSGHPMKMLSCALLLHGMLEKPSAKLRTDLLKVIARIPEITARIINHHGNWGQTPPRKKELGYIEQFMHLINLPDKGEQLFEVMQLFNLLHYDHGGGNLSCFTGKVVASGHEDLFGSLSASMSALAGPRHGKANQDCLEQAQELLEELGPDASLQEVEHLLQERLAAKKLLFGFGHAVLRVEDPRATVQYELAKRLFPQDPLVRIGLLLREAGTNVLKANPKISNPYPNVDAISGILLSAAGFAYPEYFTLLFGMSRVVGIAIQIEYEREHARGGKGVPIVRPKFIYQGKSHE